MRLKHFLSKFFLAIAGTTIVLSAQPALADRPQIAENPYRPQVARNPHRPHSGINGITLIGPMTGACNTHDPSGCSAQPYPGAVVKVKTSDGSRLVKEFRSDENGRFRVRLRPGTYLIEPVPGPNGLPYAKPFKEIVSKHQFTRVKIYYDSGIR